MPNAREIYRGFDIEQLDTHDFAISFDDGPILFHAINLGEAYKLIDDKKRKERKQ